MRLHQIKETLETLTGVRALNVENSFHVCVLGDQPELVKPVADKLKSAGIPFRQKPKGRKFAGATYIVELQNIGTAINADWVYA